MVLASNARWGHLQPRGGTPPLTVFDVFFKAGGTQTVRGYKQDELSAYDAFGVPLGGTRLVVFNEEIRFPVFRIVKGVLFADAGNTFAERAGFSISDLEVGVGFGLRITTPLGARPHRRRLPRAGLRARESAVALLHRPDVLRVLVGRNQNRRPMPM